MQGFDPQTILPRIAAQGLERQEIRPGDWFDDDGELSYGNDVTDELCAQIEQMEA